MITLEGVSLEIDGAQLLDAVDLLVPAGGTLGLIGAGGAGKSLVLKLVCGLMRPTAGRIVLDTHEVTALGETALMPVRRQVGMIFQNYALFDYLDVGGNIGFPLAQLGVPPEQIADRVAHRLAQVHLHGIEHLYPSELSGGMKKRVCLARATIHDPPIMLCDDPTAGLDPVTTNRIFDLLVELQRENEATAIIVSHEVAALSRICDRLVMLEHGRVIFSGPPADAAEQGGTVGAFVTGRL